MPVLSPRLTADERAVLGILVSQPVRGLDAPSIAATYDYRVTRVEDALGRLADRGVVTERDGYYELNNAVFDPARWADANDVTGVETVLPR